MLNKIPRRKAIYGPPGTGKTSYLHHQMTNWVTSGNSNSDLSFISFTRSAVNEALSRVKLAKSSKFCTLHSFAFQALKLSKEEIVTISQLQDFAKVVGYPITGNDPNRPGVIEYGDELLHTNNFAIASGLSLETATQLLNNNVDLSTLKLFSDTYKSWKHTYGYTDFNDMLSMICGNDDIKIDAKFLLLDEAQDFSPLQWRVIRHISHHIPHIYIAGDDDQSIYTWAGADAHGMRRWSDDNKAEIEILNQSYRLPVKVYELSLKILDRIKTRVDKQYKPTTEPGVIEYHNMLDSVLIDTKQTTLVLYRNHIHQYDVTRWLQEHYVAYEFINGRQSPFTDKYANAIRTLMKLRNGDNITNYQLSTLRSVVHHDLKDAVDSRDFGKLIKHEPHSIINMPYGLQNYYRNVDLSASVAVRVSTIHASKGMEADTVILINSIGERTMEQMSDDEHRVWYVAVTRAKHRLIVVNGDNPYNLVV